MTQLSLEQEAAASNNAQYLQVIAGPGTGKTLTLAHRIARKIAAGCPPQEILALSFTNDACNALRHHLAAIVGEGAAHVQVFTFHSFCHHLLVQTPEIAGLATDFAIADDWDCITLMRGLDLAAKAVKTASIESLLAQPGYEEYLRRLRLQNMIDYRHLLELGPRLIAQHVAKGTFECSNLFVDEFQDTSAAQFRLLSAFQQHISGLTMSVFGDPNQEIYGFLQGSFIAFDHFASEFKPETRRLTLNYRSTASLTRFSNSQMYLHQPLQAVTSTKGDPRPSLDMTFGAGSLEMLVKTVMELGTPLNQIAILCYTNKEVAQVIDVLKSHQIPYQGNLSRALIDDANPRLVYSLFKYALQEKNVYLLYILDKARKLISPKVRERLGELSDGFEKPVLPFLSEQLGRTPKLEGIKRFRAEFEQCIASLRASYDYANVIATVERFLAAVEGASMDHSVKRLLHNLEPREGQPLVQNLLDQMREMCTHDQDGVIVRTIHSAKGLEFPSVVMPFMGTRDRPFFHGSIHQNRNYANTMYVGITRASKRLHLLANAPSPYEGAPGLTVRTHNLPYQYTMMKRLYPKLFSPLRFRKHLVNLL